MDSNDNNQPKTFKQWQNIRRARPSGVGGYYSTTSQKQMMEDMAKLGDRFYD
ncbi:hypothetical protein [Celeribacter marinus]|jgi:hypothetical protein|uniref:hypothetical protein n=1 Tax=Celeribacter marinus TaxID=1397108 RepID=UPI0012E0C88E|nr:hypothetical protein [Celeribacter marinus]